jgi:hypothetical protein
MRDRLTIVVAAMLLAACNSHQSIQESETPPTSTRIPADSDLEPSSIRLAQSLRSFNLVNPTSDLDANLQRGDYRFIGLNGYTCYAPGLDYTAGPTDEQDFALSHGLNCVEGTGDVLDSQLMELQHIATTYATIYNKELLRRIRSGIVK